VGDRYYSVGDRNKYHMLSWYNGRHVLVSCSSRWYYLFFLLLATGFSGSKNRKSGRQNS
jgi:hypothetical protein